jgi:hypothetical protein
MNFDTCCTVLCLERSRAKHSVILLRRSVAVVNYHSTVMLDTVQCVMRILQMTRGKFNVRTVHYWAWGGVVVKALRY